VLGSPRVLLRFLAPENGREFSGSGTTSENSTPTSSYLRRVGGADGHLEAENEISGATRGPEHSIAGALLAIERWGAGIGRCLAFAIAGHHAGLGGQGLAPGSSGQRIAEGHARSSKAGQRATRDPRRTHADERPTEPQPGKPRVLDQDAVLALVDADFLDAERFMAPARAEERPSWPSLGALGETLDRHLDGKTIAAAPSEVNRARAEILASCRAKASLSQGLFTLTVPTGGGKTLASLAFALLPASTISDGWSTPSPT